ncbi:LysR substrate-binding domain-containing protein [Clostridium sardiniense]
MNLRDLEYFHSLCNTKSFTKTAEALYVSQPSITMSLHRLEKELNTKLIIRDHSKKALSLTEAGIVFEKRAKNILYQMNEAKLEISKINSNKLKLGIPPIIGAYFFPIYIEDLLKDGFAECIEFVETGSLAMKELLLTGKVDISLIGSLSPITDESLDSVILKKDEFMLCVSEKHSLSKSKKINFKNLENEQFIVLGNSYIHNKVFEDLCIKNDISPKKIYYTNEIQTAKSLIASGLGIGVLINMAVSKRLEIKAIPLFNPIDFYISLATKRDHYMTSKENSIRELIINKSK